MNKAKTQKAIDVMAAYLRDEPIEYRALHGQEWNRISHSPRWEWAGGQYRVALPSLGEVAHQALGTPTPFAVLSAAERSRWDNIAHAVEVAVLARMKADDDAQESD